MVSAAAVLGGRHGRRSRCGPATTALAPGAAPDEPMTVAEIRARDTSPRSSVRRSPTWRASRPRSRTPAAGSRARARAATHAPPRGSGLIPPSCP